MDMGTDPVRPCGFREKIGTIARTAREPLPCSSGLLGVGVGLIILAAGLGGPCQHGTLTSGGHPARHRGNGLRVLGLPRPSWWLGARTAWAAGRWKNSDTGWTACNGANAIPDNHLRPNMAACQRTVTAPSSLMATAESGPSDPQPVSTPMRCSPDWTRASWRGPVDDSDLARDMGRDAPMSHRPLREST
jgi:hypothetical protein